MELQNSQKAKNGTLLTSWLVGPAFGRAPGVRWRVENHEWHGVFQIIFTPNSSFPIRKSPEIWNFDEFYGNIILMDHHFKNTAAGVLFELPSQFAVFSASAQQWPPNHWPCSASNARISMMRNSWNFRCRQCFSFWGGKQKLSWNLCGKSTPLSRMKEFLLFFHSLKSLFFLLRPLVSNWAIPTRCTTSASNRSRTSTVACPGDHVCKDIEYIGRKICVYLQYINVCVYDMHIIEKKQKYIEYSPGHTFNGSFLWKAMVDVLESSFLLCWTHGASQNPHLNWTGTTVYLHEGTLVSLFHQLNQGTTLATQNHKMKVLFPRNMGYNP